MRLKRLAKQGAKRGASSISGPAAKRAKGDPSGAVVRIRALETARAEPCGTLELKQAMAGKAL